MAKKKKIYKSKSPIISKKDAQVVGERLDYLTTKNNGEIKPCDIVDDARSKSSVLHRYFDWNDETASEKYRKHQARMLMASVVEVGYVKGTKTEQKSFFSVKNSKGKSVYVTLERVTQKPDYMNQLISEAVDYISYLGNTLELMQNHLKKRK